jgi:hypothetical protein
MIDVACLVFTLGVGACEVQRPPATRVVESVPLPRAKPMEVIPPGAGTRCWNI